MSYEPTLHGKSYDESTIRGSTNAQVDSTLEGCTSAEAKAMAHIITQFNERMSTTNCGHGSSYVTIYSLKKGLEDLRIVGSKCGSYTIVDASNHPTREL
jgi:hypothetical protein